MYHNNDSEAIPNNYNGNGEKNNTKEDKIPDVGVTWKSEFWPKIFINKVEPLRGRPVTNIIGLLTVDFDRYYKNSFFKIFKKFKTRYSWRLNQ